MKLHQSSKSILCVVIISLWGFAAQAQEEPPGRNVESLLAIARERNPDYASARHEAEAATARIASAGALPDPKLRTELRDITRMGDQNAALSPSRVGSTSYQLMQDIPWFGKRDLKREVAELEAKGATGLAFSAWSDIEVKIKTTYAQLYFLHQNERLARELLELAVWLEKIAQARYAGGLAAQQDVIRAQVEHTGIRNELLALEAERRQAQARLNALLARPANSALAEPEQLRPLPTPAKIEYSALEARVMAQNPRLASEDSRVKAAEKTRELTYKNRYPDFTFGITPIQYRNSIKEWELMVEMNIPLQQGARRAQERESEAMVDAARTRREATTNQVLSDLSENLSGLDAARRTEQLITDSLLPQSELTFKSAMAGYENGKVDFATLLDAQRQIRQAKQTLIKAQAEGQARLAEIERILGEAL